MLGKQYLLAYSRVSSYMDNRYDTYKISRGCYVGEIVDLFVVLSSMNIENLRNKITYP